MDFKKANASYEKWLSAQIPLLENDLVLKHTKTAVNPFLFLRATFFRWAQLWNDVPLKIRDVPHVLSVGDLHIENFGTWRDGEGRLVWGVNDFDEAYPLPFTFDLVRLCVSTYLAIEENHLCIDKKAASESIINGYIKGIECNGKPFVLEEKQKWLRKIGLSKLKEPDPFWKRIEKLPDLSHKVPIKISNMLKSSLPGNVNEYRIAHRVAGLGSLGHQRFLIICKWEGSHIARECKTIIPSAVTWANRLKKDKIYYKEILEKAVRCHDPFLTIQDTWLIRKISPNCSRIDLFTLPQKRDEKKLLQAMGFETANIHLGTKEVIHEIIQKLKHLPSNWLHETSVEMVNKVKKDWKESI